ncbi:MAG: hypothetical protein Q7R93_00795 [bacterium]|nr:hypothetical protein [bacterium]
MEPLPTSSLLNALEKEPEWMKQPLFTYLAKNSGPIILCTLLFLLYGFFLAHPIDLTTADLGRHIKNGEVLLTDTSVLSTNLYSYTNPDFPVVNHHWGSGVLFYVTWKLFGFTGVHLFFIALSMAALLVFLLAGRRYASWGIVGLVALPAIFLLGERTEIRPEVFSYLFAGLFFYLLCRNREVCHPRESGDPEEKQESLDSRLRGNDRDTIKLLWLLPILEILWVNTHIYFLLGPLIVGAFLLESLLTRREHFRKLLSIFGIVGGAMLVNPFGYRAITAAFTLFNNFGYMLAENQPVWFMEKLSNDPNFLIFKIVFGILTLSFVAVLARDWRKFRLSHFFVATGMSILAWLAIRNLALFGLFSIPFIAGNLALIFKDLRSREALAKCAIGFSVAVLIISISLKLPQYFPYWRQFGLGLEKGNDASIQFLENEQIHGPYFNNYDIGGYLIFHLFPKEKVFVDNRPEAYPAAFFSDVYIPMQEDKTIWEKQLKEHDFNAIIFAYHDATPWGQHFLVERIQDAAWAPVYVDNKVLILLRRTERNQARIKAFLIPPEAFRISS